MTLTLRSADLGKMTPDEREHALDVALAASPQDIILYRSIVRSRLRAFEDRYEIASERLVEALKTRALRDTADTAQWLVWLTVWNFIARQTGTD